MEELEQLRMKIIDAGLFCDAMYNKYKSQNNELASIYQTNSILLFVQNKMLLDTQKQQQN